MNSDILRDLPCAVLVTDDAGTVQFANRELCVLIGRASADMDGAEIETGGMDLLFPPASRIFIQTHVWPMLLTDGSVKEIALMLAHADGRRIPVLVNCRVQQAPSGRRVIWTLFAAQERAEFETQLLAARTRAESATRAIAESERFMRLIADTMPALVSYWDLNLVCRFANRTYRDVFRIEPAQMIGKHLRVLFGDVIFDRVTRQIAAVLSGETQTYERTMVNADGANCHMLGHMIPDLDGHGNVVGFLILAIDVTLIKSAEAELTRAASVFQNTIEAIMITNADGTILSVNPAFVDITGYAAADVIGHSADILHPEGHERIHEFDVQEKLALDGRWKGEIWNRRKDGSVFRAWKSINRIESSTDGVTYVRVFNDITELWQKEQRIRFLAFHDPLTELPNRAHVTDRLGEMIADATKTGAIVAVMFLDLDGFKQINDELGHETGDRVLKEVAQRLVVQVRATDMVARLGGDEFVILLNAPHSFADVANVAERVVSGLHEPFALHGRSVAIAASVGISFFGTNGTTPAELLKSADKAMYVAKSGGKNAYRFAHDAKAGTVDAFHS